MGSKNSFFSFFTGNKDKEDEAKEEVRSYAYLEYLLDDERMDETLGIVNRIVAMDNWLFQPSETGFQYHNKSMENAITVGREAQNTVEYLNGQIDYNGVQLNKDVLKTVLVHFMDTIEAFEFEAARGDLAQVYQQALNTPEEMIKYILEERKSKLDVLSRDPEGSYSREFATRIFEYDLILQVAGDKTPSDGKYIDELSEIFEQAINDHYNHQQKVLDEQTDQFTEEVGQQEDEN